MSDPNTVPAPAINETTNGSLGSAPFEQFDSGVGEGGSEVVAHHDGLLYVTNGEEDMIDIFDIATGEKVTSINLLSVPFYGGVNSVDVTDTGIAVAIENSDPDANGFVAIFPLPGTTGPGAASFPVIEAGNLPDMLTYSKDGTKIFVANEGEPTDEGDPAGSISIIDVATNEVMTFGFEQFDSMVDELRDMGVRIFPDKLPSTDFEPEYIAEGADGNLYVSLQEANAIAVFNLEAMEFTKIIPLGTVDHSVSGSGIDSSDRDDAINIREVPVQGLRMPDAIATVEIDGQTYILTANEGDARDEDARIEDLELDPTAFPDAATLQQEENIGRLEASTIDGDTDGDGDFDELFSYGSRSFTIFDTDGNVVFDSGDEFEQFIALNRVANAFNNDDFPTDNPDVVDENRSDNKGPEPEAIEVGTIGDMTLAFIGLERDSGIMIYDISNPEGAIFLDYIEGSELGDISPEIIEFIPAEDSVSGNAQIAVSYEVSGTTTVFDLELGRDIMGTSAADVIDGTLGDDMISGKGGADLIDGNAGDDVLLGNGGGDMLFGGTGDDDLRGGSGRDQLNGGMGDDILNGGQGIDTFIFQIGGGDDTVTRLNNNEVLDMTATGLAFDDLMITAQGGQDYLVEYGDQGDSIFVTLGNNNAALTEDDFLF